MPAFRATRTITGNDTPTSDNDDGSMIIVNGTATVSLTATGWTAGRSAIGFLVQSGTCTFAGSGATVTNATGDLATATAYTYVVAHYRSAGQWVITGTETPYLVGGTDVAVADGGTGASTAAAARANLAAAARYVFNIEDYGAVGDGTTDDAAAIQDAIDAANAAGGGTVLIPPGTFAVESGFTLPQRVGVTGTGRGSYLIVTDTVTTLFTYQGPGAGGFLRDFEVQASENLTNFVKVDTWSFLDVSGVWVYEILGHFALVTEDQSGGSNTEHVRFSLCEVNNTSTTGGLGFAKVTAGATGYCTDIYFDRCFALNVTDWGIELVDAQRCKVIDCYVGSNLVFDGGVLIASTGVPAGAPGDNGQHKVDSLHVEDFHASGNAQAVRIEATAAAGSGDTLRYNDISRLSMSPSGGRTIVEVVNNSSNAYIVLQNTIRDFAMVPYSADSIKVGSTTFGTNIEQLREADKISNYVTLSGMTWSRVNGWQQAQGYGAGATPAMTFLDCGDFVRNTDDGSIWAVDETGTPRRIGLATLSNAYTASNVTTDRAFNANSTTLDEVADVLGTLLADLKTAGVLP